VNIVGVPHITVSDKKQALLKAEALQLSPLIWRDKRGHALPEGRVVGDLLQTVPNDLIRKDRVLREIEIRDGVCMNGPIAGLLFQSK